MSTEGHFSGVTDEALAMLSLPRRVGMSVNSFQVIPDLLQLTDMIAVVPHRMVLTNNDLILLPFPLKIPGFTKSMAWHERTHRDPSHQWVRALCAEVSPHPGL